MEYYNEVISLSFVNEFLAKKTKLTDGERQICRQTYTLVVKLVRI